MAHIESMSDLALSVSVLLGDGLKTASKRRIVSHNYFPKQLALKKILRAEICIIGHIHNKIN